MDTIILTLFNHEKFQTNLNHIYAGELDKRLFEFVNYTNFTGEIALVNERLKPNLFIPEIKSMGKNHFIRISRDFNSTHLTFTIHLPVLSRNLYELYEFIPIPIRDGNSIFILDTKPITFYHDKSRINILPETERANLCMTQDDLTICNTLMEESFLSPSNCVRNLLIFKSDENCIHKPIEFQNYFIRLTEQKIYAFIVKPIELVRQCGDTERVFHLTESREISVKIGCTLGCSTFVRI